MWAGVEPDVALFASGRALDEGGEWSGGHPLTEAAEGAHGPSAPTPCTAARTPAQDAGLSAAPFANGWSSVSCVSLPPAVLPFHSIQRTGRRRGVQSGR